MGRRLFRIVVAVSAVVAALVGGGWLALRHEPAFYAAAAAVDPATQIDASTELFNRGQKLKQDLRRHGSWQALFTTEQINGFLAVDFPKQFPGALPPGVYSPRVDMQDGELTLAYRYDHAGVSSVVSVTVEGFLVDSHTIGIRLRSAQAGAVPLPLGQVVEAVTSAAQAMDIPLRWRQQDGEPVAMFSVSPHDPRLPVTLEKLVLRSGELYVSGKTERLSRTAE